MTVAIQIREVPEDVRDTIATRAAARGQSMQAYLLDVLKGEAQRAHNSAAFAETAHFRTAIPAGAIEEIVREGREHGETVDRDEYQA